MSKLVEILIIFFSYSVVANSAQGITCVQCSATRENRIQGNLPCSEFDWSNKYLIECPKSTLCFKKTYSVPLGNGREIQSIERGCAAQKQFVQNYDRTARKWYKTEVIVKSVYEEGCSRGEDNGRPGIPAEYCYCGSWLCNKSSSFRKISYALGMMHAAVMLLCAWMNFNIS